jgi:hypothetical protein
MILGRKKIEYNFDFNVEQHTFDIAPLFMFINLSNMFSREGLPSLRQSLRARPNHFLFAPLEVVFFQPTLKPSTLITLI